MPKMKLTPLQKELSRKMFAMDLTAYQVVYKEGCKLTKEQLADIIDGLTPIDRYIDGQLCIIFGEKKGYWFDKYGPKEPKPDPILL